MDFFRSAMCLKLFLQKSCKVIPFTNEENIVITSLYVEKRGTGETNKKGGVS